MFCAPSIVVSRSAPRLKKAANSSAQLASSLLPTPSATGILLRDHARVQTTQQSKCVVVVVLRLAVGKIDDVVLCAADARRDIASLAGIGKCRRDRAWSPSCSPGERSSRRTTDTPRKSFRPSTRCCFCRALILSPLIDVQQSLLVGGGRDMKEGLARIAAGVGRFVEQHQTRN